MKNNDKKDKGNIKKGEHWRKVKEWKTRKKNKWKIMINKIRWWLKKGEHWRIGDGNEKPERKINESSWQRKSGMIKSWKYVK